MVVCLLRFLSLFPSFLDSGGLDLENWVWVLALGSDRSWRQGLDLSNGINGGVYRGSSGVPSICGGNQLLLWAGSPSRVCLVGSTSALICCGFSLFLFVVLLYFFFRTNGVPVLRFLIVICKSSLILIKKKNGKQSRKFLSQKCKSTPSPILPQTKPGKSLFHLKKKKETPLPLYKNLQKYSLQIPEAKALLV